MPSRPSVPKNCKETDYETELISSNSSHYRKRKASDPVLDSIEGAFLLQDDFLQNGLYFSKVSRLTKPLGFALDWNRTFRDSLLLQRTESFLPRASIGSETGRQRSFAGCYLLVRDLCAAGGTLFLLLPKHFGGSRIQAHQKPTPSVLEEVASLHFY